MGNQFVILLLKLITHGQSEIEIAILKTFISDHFCITFSEKKQNRCRDFRVIHFKRNISEQLINKFTQKLRDIDWSNIQT